MFGILGKCCSCTEVTQRLTFLLGGESVPAEDALESDPLLAAQSSPEAPGEDQQEAKRITFSYNEPPGHHDNEPSDSDDEEPSGGASKTMMPGESEARAAARAAEERIGAEERKREEQEAVSHAIMKAQELAKAEELEKAGAKAAQERATAEAIRKQAEEAAAAAAKAAEERAAAAVARHRAEEALEAAEAAKAAQAGAAQAEEEAEQEAVEEAEMQAPQEASIQVDVGEEEKAEALAMFERIDKNGDGSLTHGEMKKFMQQEPWARTLLAGESFHWQDFFGALDTDRDGSVQESEFIDFYVTSIKPHVEMEEGQAAEHEAARQDLTANVDLIWGGWSAAAGAEMQAPQEANVQVEVGEEEKAEALAMFERIDKNGDGSLTHREIKKFMQQEPWARTLLAGESFHWQDFFGALDTDRDGSVQESEFIDFYVTSIKPHVEVAAHPKSSDETHIEGISDLRQPGSAVKAAEETSEGAEAPLDEAVVEVERSPGKRKARKKKKKKQGKEEEAELDPGREQNPHRDVFDPLDANFENAMQEDTTRKAAIQSKLDAMADPLDNDFEDFLSSPRGAELQESGTNLADEMQVAELDGKTDYGQIP